MEIHRSLKTPFLPFFYFLVVFSVWNDGTAEIEVIPKIILRCWNRCRFTGHETQRSVFLQLTASGTNVTKHEFKAQSETELLRDPAA